MRRPKALPAIAVALVALGLSASSAGAETVHVYSQTISGNELAGTALNTPKGVAVDGSSGPNSGSVYVADSNNNRISKFNAAGQFQLMWGINVNEGSGDPERLHQRRSPDRHLQNRRRTPRCRGRRSGPSVPTQPIVVDSTSGPSAGDIYVLGFTGSSGTTIQKFDPSGHLVTAYGTGSPFPGRRHGPGRSEVDGDRPLGQPLHLQRRGHRPQVG